MDTGITVIDLILKGLVGTLIGILLGNGAVYFFNRMPAAWFTEYGQTPSEELLNSDRQRVKSWPWKYLFSMFFSVTAVYLLVRDWRYALVVVFALWLLLEISIGDLKYHIIADQLVILLAISSIGMIPYLRGWKDMLMGAVLGLIIMLVGALLGRMIYRKPAVGGGDIKLFTVLGFLTGREGILAILLMSAFLSSAHLIIRLIRKTVKKGEAVPMAPYIAVSTMIYMILLHDRIAIWMSSFVG